VLFRSVEVTSTSIAGTTFFCASAGPGPAVQINIGTGNGQRGEAGGQAREPLRAWVSDACNGVAGIPVTFTVVEGGGRVNDRTSVTIPTSITGHAAVEFTYGPDEGNNVVEASFAGNGTAPARFTLFGVARGRRFIDGPSTSFSGVVLNNSEQPIQGANVTLSAEGQTFETQSDVDGRFRLSDLPVSGLAGLHVDGSTAFHVGGPEGMDVPLGTYPALHFEPFVVPLTDNSLGMPVLLPALNPNNARVVDNTQDVELTAEGIEGLKMIIRAGSMRRANGTIPSPADPAIASLNQVHHDKVPMPMPDGVAPPFAWTLQPGGATFDPPVEIIYPNMTGLPPGTVAYFLSFNHDTGRFEIVASGTVSEDGSVIRTDPGAGISVAGWGCNCPPYAVTGDCANCTVSITNTGLDAVLPNDPVTLIADVDPTPGTTTWTGGETPPTGGGGSFTTSFSTPGTKTIKAEFDPDDGDPCDTTYEIAVVNASFAQAPGQVYGFDNRTDAVNPHKSLEAGGADAVVANLGASTDQVFFVPADNTVLSVLPDQSASATETLTLNGGSVGFTELEARLNNPGGDEAAALQVSVYNKISKTVMIRLVHEDNDDLQFFAVGFMGTPNTKCVLAGANAFVDTVVTGDDVVVADGIEAGPNGTCDSAANGIPNLSTDVTDAVVLNYLNNIAYNQAVIEWTVTRLPAVTVNFDLNRDGQIDVNTAFLANPEMQAVRDAAKDETFDRNVFLVDGPTDGSFGFAGFNQRFAFIHGGTHTGSAQLPENTIAHELGHTLGMCHPDFPSCISDPDVLNLMHSVATNPALLRKAQWDQLNP